MIATKETVYTKDVANNKMSVVREFDAPLEKVWKAWTESKFLDQWWAPKPWKAVTQSMDFREGGTWLYYMQGPEGERHYCRNDYNTIVPNKVFTGIDAFCDENGNINKDFPVMDWKTQFTAIGDRTRVNIELTFASEEDMKKNYRNGLQGRIYCSAW